jgi:hypothetical protein
MRPGDEGIAVQEVAPRFVSGLGEADSRSRSDVAGASSVIADPEGALSGGEIASVVAGASDAEGLAEAAGAGGEL